MKSTIQYFQEGHILPIKPIKVFNADSIQDSFRYMQKGQHIGKIVVSLGKAAGKLEGAGSKKTYKFSPKASYLLIGGLGGLGRAISTWMVENGARNIIYLSRSAGSGPDDQSFFRELESQGCDVQLVKGSVSNPDDVNRAVHEAHNPLKGILQMSLVLRDQAFNRMTHEEWNGAIAPKVQGTWNLHNTTTSAGIDLDFFVLFSSLSAVIGQPGQANYAGANTFLDAFAQYRNGLNLAASVIDIGPVEDIGYVARSEGILRKMKASGAYGIREPELLDSLMLSLFPASDSKPNPRTAKHGFVAQSEFVLGLASTIPLSNPANRALWKKDRRMAAYHNSVHTAEASGSTSSNEVLKSFLATAKSDPFILKNPESSILLAKEIGKKLFDFLLKPGEDLDISRSLADMGMDSLVAIEMRSWWKQVFEFDISVLEMLGTGTLEALGGFAAAGLLKAAGAIEEETAS